MKILYITLRRLLKNTTAGGESHILDLLHGIESNEVNNVIPYILYPCKEQLCVLDYKNNKEYEYEGSSSMGDIFRDDIINKSFRKIITELSIDIVHFQNFQTLPLSIIKVAKEQGKKVVMTVHDYFLWCDNFTLLSPNNHKNRLSFCFFEKSPDICSLCLKALGYQPSSSEYIQERRRYIDILLGMVDKFIFPTEYPKSVLLSLYDSVATAKCEVIEHGIDSSLIQNGGGDYYKVGNRNLNIAFLGAFRKAKGSDVFVELLNYFKDEGDINFFIYGRIEDYIQFSHKNLFVIGEYMRDKIPFLLKEREIDLILLLSPWPETYSYTLTEAIVSGIPVIATDLGALRERGSKYFVGWLVPYEDPLKRIIDIINAIKNDRDILYFFKKRLLNESSKKIPTLHDMARRYIELYKSLI